jgi:hypothetical protein
MKNALLAVLIILICSCSSVPDYTSRVDRGAFSENEAIVRLDVPHAITPEVMSRLLLKEAARAAIERGAVYFCADSISIGPVVSSTPHEPVDRSGYERSGPDERSGYDRSGNDRDYRTSSGMTSTEAAIESTIIALLSINREKQRSGSLHMTFGTEPLPGDHVFDAGKLLDALRDGGDVTKAQP